ncbi:MAG: serine/threonine protein kinase [bacterium]|nr:serine/threonine protein kinase [bacterium]
MRFHAAREIFIDALGLAPEARESFVLRACGDDPNLLDEVRDLLANDAGAGDPVDGADPWARQVVVPETIGPWRILGLLGQGGMGIVFKARRLDDDDAPAVALKVLRTGLGNADLERRFRREVEVLRRLDHPGIARLLDAGTDDTGAPWLATEYIDGVTLNRWRVETESTPEQRVLLLAELCDAVHAAHGHGVIHRDLKPENVLVTREGRPKVLDFGIARLQDDSVPLATLVTQTWQLLGTIRYMSPEQAAGGAAAIDERTDIYTLGVIAYELLAGTLPYNLSRLSTPRALLEITTAEPRPLSGRDSAIDLIIQHALAKDPGQRYPTAAAMADDLRRQAENRSISLRRPGPTARVRRALRTRPRLRRLALMAAVTLAAASVTLALVLGGDRNQGPNWETFFTIVEEADMLRHSGPRDEANYLAAAALFQKARSELVQLPEAPFTDDLNRYIRWRLGELFYFRGDAAHDAALLEQARGYWRDAALVPWKQGSGLAIDPRMVARVNILQLGAHQAWAGVGMAHTNLAELQTPVTHWRLAYERYRISCEALGDATGAFHDESVRPNQRLEARALARLNLGVAIASLGAVLDSLDIIDRGLKELQAARDLNGVKDISHHSILAEAMGTAYLARSALAGDAAVANLDSAQYFLDAAAGTRAPTWIRGYWSLCRTRGRLAEERARLADDDRERTERLRAAAREYEMALQPLRPEKDDFECALAHADLAGVTAWLGAVGADRTAITRADSLLAIDSIFLQDKRFPLQFAERQLRLGQVRLMDWRLGGDSADSTAAMDAFARARGVVSVRELPSLHRRSYELASATGN